MSEGTPSLLPDVSPAMVRALQLALAEERGLLIVALYEMDVADLERLVEAVQLLDSEGVACLEFEDRVLP